LLEWLRGYRGQDFGSDLIAGIITAIVLLPQAVAFAILAGLPPETGLYASIFPPAIYALFGTSRTLSVGPVSVAAIMVASALAAPELAGQGEPTMHAMVLAIETGIILLAMAILRMGALINFVSHPVLSGFTSGAAVLIILSQLPSLLGLQSMACAGDAPFACRLDYWRAIDPATASLGVGALAILAIFADPLHRWLGRCGLPALAVTAISRSGPLLVVVAGAFIVTSFASELSHTIAIVGPLPAGLPHSRLDFMQSPAWGILLPAAASISLIVYVESVAIAKLTARLRRQRIDADRELVGLGLANVAAALSGSLPVAGGLSRTMVNFAAGAQTQLASLVTAALIALAAMYLTTWFALVPKATLAAVILLAILPLVKIRSIASTWRYNPSDGAAQFATFAGVLALGVEAGLVLGIALSLLFYLWRTSKPHIAVVGRVPGTEHFRNVLRHQVETWPELLFIRIDENLSFANAGYVEDFIAREVHAHPEAKHLIVIASAINDIDATGMESLESLANTLVAAGVTLHLAEVKGPVMDRFTQCGLPQRLAPGTIYFRTELAVDDLARSNS
jgi:SulP family sulfate permease